MVVSRMDYKTYFNVNAIDIKIAEEMSHTLKLNSSNNYNFQLDLTASRNLY